MEIKNQENEYSPKNEATKANRIFDTVVTVFVYLLSACILIGAVFFSFNVSPDKSILGYRYYIVLTESMSPKYNVGDVVFVHIENSDNINVGDVITFNPSSDSDAYLTHRVTEKLTDYLGTEITCFKTKGDANDSEDSFLIDETRVIGKVTAAIPKIGYIIRFVRLKWYYIVVIAIMVIVFFKLMKVYIAMDIDGSEKQSGNTPEKDLSTC